MRFIFTADWHIGLNTDSYLVKGEGNSRLKEQKDCLWQIYYYCVENNIRKVVVGGDIYHTSSPSPASEEMLHSWLCYCQKKEIEVIFLMGNHDFNSSGKSALHPLQALNLDNVKVITHPDVIYDILFLPHVQESLFENYRNTVNELLKQNPKCITAVAHNHTSGAMTGYERRLLNNGENTWQSYPRQIENVLLGHIHKPQEFVVNGYQKCVYSGSLIKNDISENDDVKRFLDVSFPFNFSSVPLDVRSYWVQKIEENDVPSLDFSEANGKIIHIEILNSTGKYTKNYFKERLFGEQIKTIKFHSIVENKVDTEFKNMGNFEAIDSYFALELDRKLAKEILGSAE